MFRHSCVIVKHSTAKNRNERTYMCNSSRLTNTVLILLQLAAAAAAVTDTDTSLVNVALSHRAPSVGSNFWNSWAIASGFVASSRWQVN